MATDAGNLEAARTHACRRLAELDSVPLSQRARMTYSDGDKTYDWNAYRRALTDHIRELTELIVMVGGPVEVRVIQRSA